MIALWHWKFEHVMFVYLFAWTVALVAVYLLAG
jgi:hypothetical protein